jgi:hypothetical protein
MLTRDEKLTSKKETAGFEGVVRSLTQEAEKMMGNTPASKFGRQMRVPRRRGQGPGRAARNLNGSREREHIWRGSRVDMELVRMDKLRAKLYTEK